MDSYQPYPIRRHAVLCSLAELPDGGLRVVMDDLRQAEAPGQWKNHTFVTFKDYAAGSSIRRCCRRRNLKHSVTMSWFACWR